MSSDAPHPDLGFLRQDSEGRAAGTDSRGQGGLGVHGRGGAASAFLAFSVWRGQDLPVHPFGGL